VQARKAIEGPEIVVVMPGRKAELAQTAVDQEQFIKSWAPRSGGVDDELDEDGADGEIRGNSV
jgi:hypothetical protein